MADRFEHDAPRLDRNTILSYDRTRLSYQRTMLAWVRTGTSLIGFGVAIYNFHRMTGGQLGSYLIGPHEFALHRARNTVVGHDRIPTRYSSTQRTICRHPKVTAAGSGRALGFDSRHHGFDFNNFSEMRMPNN